MCHSKYGDLVDLSVVKGPNLFTISMAQWLGWWTVQCCQYGGMISNPPGEQMSFQNSWHMYICVYVYIYVYVYMCICIYMYVHIYIYIIVD